MEENVHQELEQLSPLLSELRKKPEGLRVPEGYFAAMQNDVLQQLKIEKTSILAPIKEAKSESKMFVWWKNIAAEIEWLINPRYAVAFASLALMITAGWYFLQPNSSNNATLSLKDIPTEEIDQYLEEHLDEIDTEQIWVSTEPSVVEIEPKYEDNSTKMLPESKPKKLKDATDHELDEMIDEMIQNGDLSQEDLEDIL